MDLSIYLSPVADFLQQSYQEEQLGNHIQFYTDTIPDLEGSKIALIGVLEDRNAYQNGGCAQGPDRIRQYLYQLYKGDGFLPIIDLGNIKAGAEVSDTYHAVEKVVEHLVKNNVIPFIIGGGQDLTYANYMAYQNLEQLVNLVTVDARFDLGSDLEEPISSRSFMGKILTQQPNFLFNYTNIGYQTYFVGSDVLELMDKLYFDSIRLGNLRSDTQEVEPLVRNADVLSFDIGAIKAADAPGNKNATPNGLSSDECCSVMRYAGLSDKLTSVGVYEYNPEFDPHGQTAHLIAQMIWYFVEGVRNRRNDVPVDNHSSYLRYRVAFDELDQEVLFYKSVKTDRWWMNVPFPANSGNRFKRHEMVPCSYQQYQSACNNEMPDLWLKTYQKML